MARDDKYMDGELMFPGSVQIEVRRNGDTFDIIMTGRGRYTMTRRMLRINGVERANISQEIEKHLKDSGDDKAPG